jgi:hypothetical protein
VLVAGGQLIGKTYANNPWLQSVPTYFESHPSTRSLALPYQYASAPIPSLDVLVDASGPWPATNGCAVFTIGCRVLSAAGAPVEPVPPVRPFTAVPLRWNTFTALDLPLLDGGLVLVLPLILVLGVGIGFCWAGAMQRRMLAITVYALMVAGLITSSGSFNFLAPQYVGAAALSWLLVVGFGRTARRRDSAPARHPGSPRGVAA